MNCRAFVLLCLCMVGLLVGTMAQAAELIFPQNRLAYFTDEPIEIAIAGLAKDASAKVEIVPAATAATPVAFTLTSSGSTVTAALPALTLTPGKYAVQLDGKKVADLTIASGVWQSTMLVGQADSRVDSGANFILGNTFSFGLVDNTGQPMIDVRGRKSGSFNSCEQWLASDRPVLNYMYWTGYVTHKPYGSQKSWANAQMMEAMQIYNYAEGQRLRKYGKTIFSTGPIDEPGLSWGATPAGGMASGFPNWDEQPWYEKHGLKYTQDIANGSDADWMKYMAARGAIIKENYALASKEIKASFPSHTFAGDLYALSAIMDGTDSLNQTANDIPTSHVFFDWFGGPMAVPGQIYLEKAYMPETKLAHAMNGQLWRTPANPRRPLYHLLMNGMLQGGLDSNWWLNYGGMTPADLLAVNEPAGRLGPLFINMTLGGHDVALLWGYTELALRQKDMAARESKKASGQQIKLMVPMPKAGEMTQEELASNAYEIGGTYQRGVLDMHQALRRAGYPTHIVDERLLASGILKKYQTLVIAGQTFPLPASVLDAITKFQKAGGTVVVDKSTTVNIPGAVVCAVDFGADTLRARNMMFERKIKAATTKRETSLYESNQYESESVRTAVAPVKAAMAKSKAHQAVATDNIDLSIERHVGGDGALYMVLNGHEAFPENVADDTPYPRYNPAPAKGVTFTLQGIKPGSTVYAIEGLDWKTVRKLDNPSAPQTVNFDASEMKLYLVAPKDPAGITTTATTKNNTLTVTTKLNKAKMPWPLTVTVSRPDSAAMYTIYRATNAQGVYTETFPLGGSAVAGAYKVMVESPVGGYKNEQTVQVSPLTTAPAVIADSARVFDAPVIRQFLASKPAVVIAVANAAQQPVAEKLAAALQAKGVKAEIKPEAEVYRKVAYPRVWNPTATIYSPTDAKGTIPADVKVRVTISTDKDGNVTMVDADGKPVNDYRTPDTLVTIAGEGYLDWSGDDEIAYEAGCMLYFDKDRKMSVLGAAAKQVKTTEEVKARWAKPWQRLISNVGGYQLPPSLPEAYTADSHLIVMGDSTSSQLVRILQAAELPMEYVDAKYPGPGKALVSFIWSPFAVEKNVILIGASDDAGIQAGVAKVAELASK